MSNMIPRMAHLLKGSTAIKVIPFTPLALFANNEVGAWYDPSDMSTMFQDAAGTTPVTAVEQPVSLIYDKSKSLTLGSELVTNGNFSNGTTGWAGTSSTIDVVSGELRVSNSATTNYGNANQSITCTVGKWYIATISARIGTTPIAYLSIRSGAANGTQVALAQTSSTTLTTLTVRFLANNTTMFVVLSNDVGGIGATAFFDNISVKEIAGNHAYTPSTATASRPVLSARYNLLTKTEQFDDGVWNKVGINSTGMANVITAPNGTLTADKWQETAGGTGHNLRISNSVTAGVTYIYSVYAKAAENLYVGLFGLNGKGKFFNLSNGTVGNNIGSAPASSGIESVGDGWYRCWISDTEPSTVSRNFDIYSSKNGINWDYSGTLNDGIYIWGADLRVANDGVSIPTYQRVNTSTDYDTTNFPMYLRFDGSDDYMLTGTITPGTDKAQVFAGVRKLSDAAVGVILEASATTELNNGSLGLFAPRTPSSLKNYGTHLRGTARSEYETGAFAAPITNVLVGLYDIAETSATDEQRLRVNAVQQSLTANVSGPSGTGNFLAYPIYIGRRGGTTLPYNGRLYGMIVRFGANLDNTQITNTETWMNGKTKAY